MNSKSCLLIFTRNPELGKCKTRLAKTIGDEKALKIYHILLAHTQRVTVGLPMDKRVCYSVKIRSGDIWSDDHFQKYQQRGRNLGARMQHAFATAFAEGYEKVVIIGSDCFELRSHHLETAFNLLDRHDVVIGPAKDGGYYLLGMKTIHPPVFQHKNWGSHTVLATTLKDLKNNTIGLLETLNDVDEWEDVEREEALRQWVLKGGK